VPTQLGSLEWTRHLYPRHFTTDNYSVHLVNKLPVGLMTQSSNPI